MGSWQTEKVPPISFWDSQMNTARPEDMLVTAPFRVPRDQTEKALTRLSIFPKRRPAVGQVVRGPWQLGHAWRQPRCRQTSHADQHPAVISDRKRLPAEKACCGVPPSSSGADNFEGIKKHISVS